MKNYIYLILIYLVLTGVGYAISRFLPSVFEFTDLSILLTGALGISIIITVVFFRGIKKSEKKGVLHTLSAVGLKFLLFLALLGIFAITKKDMTVQYLLAFFVIYLTFSFYLLFTFVVVLKQKNQNTPDGQGN